MYPSSVLTDIAQIAVTDGATPVAYVVANQALYRSVTPSFSLWTKQRDLSATVAPDPRQPNHLILSAHGQLLHSLDGGHTVTLVAGCPMVYGAVARALSAPRILYATNTGRCIPPNRPTPSLQVQHIVKSVDDGLTWTTVYTTTTDDYPGASGFDRIAIAPSDPRSVVVSEIHAHSEGDLLATRDGGHIWRMLRYSPTQTPADALAFNPLTSFDLWVAWGWGPSILEHNGVTVVQTVNPNTMIQLSGSLAYAEISDLAFDPLSGRLYISVAGQAYATMTDYQTFQRLWTPVGRMIAVSRNGYLLTGDWKTPLQIIPLIGSGVWDIALPLLPAAAEERGVIGGTISPARLCGRYLCQYFDKGGLEAIGAGQVAALPLVPPLLTAGLGRPVGGEQSSVTYALLNQARLPRHPPPLGLRHGTIAVPGGVFVPETSDQRAAPGYIVPTYFWTYMTSHTAAPHGWRQDIGLPLSNPLRATVTKGRLGRRAIVIQAFQDAILTYDPRNSPVFRVERANIGVDYAAVFPAQVH